MDDEKGKIVPLHPKKSFSAPKEIHVFEAILKDLEELIRDYVEKEDSCTEIPNQEGTTGSENS